jgi:hypothetical protein
VSHVVQWQLQRLGDAALPQPSGRVVIWLDPSFLTFDVSSCQVRPPSCGALHMMLQGGGGAERLYIGFDFMGRARGRGRLQAGLGGRGGVGSQAALCFVAHIAASQQVRRRLVRSTLHSSQASSTACCCQPEVSLQRTILFTGAQESKRSYT